MSLHRGKSAPQDDPKWSLERGAGEPMIWPFRTREDADEWALDHGLIDYEAREMAEAPEHEEICARCREPWPCEHERLDREARRILYNAKHTCHRCRQQIGGMLIRVEGGGSLGEDVSYHGRKGACRNLAMRELERLGHTDLLERLREDDRIAAHRRRLTKLAKGYEAEGMDRRAAYRRAFEDLKADEHALL